MDVRTTERRKQRREENKLPRTPRREERRSHMSQKESDASGTYRVDDADVGLGGQAAVGTPRQVLRCLGILLSCFVVKMLWVLWSVGVVAVVIVAVCCRLMVLVSTCVVWLRSKYARCRVSLKLSRPSPPFPLVHISTYTYIKQTQQTSIAAS